MDTITTNPTNGVTTVTQEPHHQRHHDDSWKHQISHQLGDIRSDVRTAEADIRSDIKDAESDIKTTAMQVQMDSNNNFRALDNTLSRNAAVAAKDAQDLLYRLHDNIRSTTDTILTSNALTNTKIVEEASRTNEKIAAFERHSDNKFAEVQATLAANKYENLRLELEEKSRAITNLNFGKEMSVIQSQINDLAQTQKATNQAINFGTGVIGQSSTANQVR